MTNPISPSIFPVLPLPATGFGGPAYYQIYFLKTLLNDMQPGLGDQYVQQAYPFPLDQQTIQNFFVDIQTNLADQEIKEQLDNAAQSTADVILASEGNGVPLTIDVIADQIEDAAPKFASPIIDSLAEYLRDLGLGDNSSVPSSPLPSGGTTAVGQFMNWISGLFNTAQTDPVVLDMSGNGAGVQLTSLAESNAYFDLHGTGFAVHTGWVGPTTGLLVDTPDPTNIRDLFGSSSVDGFTALAA